MEDFHKTALDSGIHKGSRYIMPLSYVVPLMFTTEENLSDRGLSAEDFSSYESVISSWEYLQSKGIGLTFARFSHYVPFYNSGWLDECLDYENATVDLSIPSFDRLIECYKNEKQAKNSDSAFYSPYQEEKSLQETEDGLFIWILILSVVYDR